MLRAIHFWGPEKGLPVRRVSLPVTEKDSVQEGKMSILPRMKYGHANLHLICAQTNKRVGI